MSPICLRGTYALGLDVFTVEALTESTVCIRDHAGNRSQISLVTFRAHWVPVP